MYNRIAIIGANGYIARNLLYYINNHSPEIVIDSYDIAEEQVDGYDNYKSVNLLDANLEGEINYEVDIMFMFAGKTGTEVSFSKYDEFLDCNERALLNVLAGYVNAKSTAKIVFPSTRLVYKGSNYPIAEDGENEYRTVYAINKFACENYLKIFNNMYGVKYVVFRICVPYGSLVDNATSYGTAEFMIKAAKEKKNITIYGDGSNRRTLTYIGDLCNILFNASICEEIKNTVYNIGGEDYSIKEMAEEIAFMYNASVSQIEFPPQALIIESGSTVFDDTKLRKAINIEYNMRLKDWCKREIKK